MLIRQAYSSDKSMALDFCKDTFSWGDYVSYTWDSWIKEGNLLVLEEDRKILGFCHSVFYFSFSFDWIEGIRIHPNYRRRRLATELIETVERHARDIKLEFSYMLIDDSNKPSISLASKLDYTKIDTWGFYKLSPRQTFTSDVFRMDKSQNVSKEILDGKNFFVKSWRWLPLNENTINDLIDKQQLLGIRSDEHSLAALHESEHFEKTLLVTIMPESKKSAKKFLDYIQNLAYQNGYDRIQVLSSSELPKMKSLEAKSNFSLFEKIL